MPNVIASHAVGNMETWLAGGEERKALFARFCRSYRVYRHPEQPKVSILFEDVDVKKMEAVLADPALEAAKAKHTVIEPIEVRFELPDVR